MKLLVVMHASDHGMLFQNIKQYNALLESYVKDTIEVDTYLFTEGILDEQLLRRNFEGKLFCDPYIYIAVENIARRIVELAQLELYDGIILLEDTLANDLASIVAIRLSWRYITNVSQLEWKSNDLECRRLVYNSNIKAKIKLQNEPFVISLCAMKNEKCIEKRKKQLQIIYLEPFPLPDFIIQQKLISARKVEHESPILIAAGRGIKSKEAIGEVREFARRRGYLFGVTRPVAMNAWGKIDEIIGVSGSIYAPKICITIGVSGASAFYAGIENSDFIVSINTDQRAPIIGMSDVSIIDSYENILNKLFTMLGRT